MTKYFEIVGDWLEEPLQTILILYWLGSTYVAYVAQKV